MNAKLSVDSIYFKVSEMCLCLCAFYLRVIKCIIQMFTINFTPLKKIHLINCNNSLLLKEHKDI